jgi:hypothetical protein
MYAVRPLGDAREGCGLAPGEAPQTSFGAVRTDSGQSLTCRKIYTIARKHEEVAMAGIRGGVRIVRVYEAVKQRDGTTEAWETTRWGLDVVTS